MAGGALAAEAWARARHGAGARSRGSGFASLVTSQLLYALSCRSQQASWTRLPPNPPLLAALMAAFAAQGAALFAPGLRGVIGASLGGRDLAAALAMGALPILAIEAIKGAGAPHSGGPAAPPGSGSSASSRRASSRS
jgi:Ca2+-transporting ATPase